MSCFCLYLCGLMKYILYAFLIYLAYKIIFDLVIPVSKATSQVKSKMREMQEAQQQAQQQHTNASKLPRRSSNRRIR
jgi:uncharacterized protein YybS (DUF2232 family)